MRSLSIAMPNGREEKEKAKRIKIDKARAILRGHRQDGDFGDAPLSAIDLALDNHKGLLQFILITLLCCLVTLSRKGHGGMAKAELVDWHKTGRPWADFTGTADNVKKSRSPGTSQDSTRTSVSPSPVRSAARGDTREERSEMSPSPTRRASAKAGKMAKARETLLRNRGDGLFGDAPMQALEVTMERHNGPSTLPGPLDPSESCLSLRTLFLILTAPQPAVLPLPPSCNPCPNLLTHPA